MSGPSTSELAGHLVRTANADPEGSTLLAQLIGDRLRWDASGAPTVLDPRGMPALDANGAPVTPAALIATFAKEMPSLFVPPKNPTVPAPRSGNLTDRAAAEHRTNQARQSTGEPENPYAKASRNLTLQVLMEKNNPALAAQMKAAAGV